MANSKLIVVSAVNLRKGGTLTILNDCLRTLSEMASERDYRIVALVHRKELALYDNIEYIELPWSVRSWAHRLWCEYVTMYKISKQLGDVYLWLSLHDTTPRVKAQHQAVYCHNSYPFFRWNWRHLLLNYRIVCFAVFTKWIYRINIHRNDYIIVQQQWFREAFKRMFNIPHDRIIVSPPKLGDKIEVNNEQIIKPAAFTFLYPAYPDVHKNFECLCEAAKQLEEELGSERFQVLLTTEASMNKYSQWLTKKWGGVKSVRFIGFVDRKRLYELYSQTNVLVFPSKVETWGLPISEFAATGKPMLLADLPYAHETAGGSVRTAFFSPENIKDLRDKMKMAIDGDDSIFKPVEHTCPASPSATSWSELLLTLTT